MSKSIIKIARERLAKAFSFPAHSAPVAGAEAVAAPTQLYDELEQIAEERAKAMQHPKGKKTARERFESLVDAGSFAEINRFLGGDIDAGYLGSGVITGFAKVNGRSVAIYAQDFSIRGGSLSEVEGRKILHLMEQALTMRIPVLAMLDSGGARIQEGVAHYMAEDEDDALDYARSLLSSLPSSYEDPAPCFNYVPSADDSAVALEVAKLVPASAKQPYDMVQVIEHLVDHGEFLQVQELFAPSIVVGFGTFAGRSVGECTTCGGL